METLYEVWKGGKSIGDIVEVEGQTYFMRDCDYRIEDYDAIMKAISLEEIDLELFIAELERDGCEVIEF